MNEQQFVAKHEMDWIRLNTLCAKADSSPSNLSGEEIREMFRLYKRVSAHLSLVRTKSTNAQLATFLNDLAARAYGTLYRPKRKRLRDALRDAVAIAAQTVRRRMGAIALSALVFFGGGLLAYIVSGSVPGARDFFVPPDAEELIEHWRDGEMDERTFGEAGMMTGFYASNNPRVSIIAGSIAAATFGVGSAKLLFDNGALLGVLAHELQPVGRTGYLFLHIFPHGVPEISGILVAGGAGFVMGWALINPGRRRRGEALKDAGKDAIVLLTTAVVLMFIAAPIEGFFSFNPRVPDWARIIVILVSVVAWGAFWTGFGRTDEETAAIELRRTSRS